MPHTAFRVALVQMSCSRTPTPTSTRAPTAFEKRRAPALRLSACRNCFARSIFASAKIIALFDLAESIPGPSTEKLARIAREEKVGSRRFPVRASCSRHLPQHRRSVRGRWFARRNLSQDAYSRRPSLLREVLFHAGRFRVSQLLFSARGNIGTLVCWDQWYPEGARITAVEGRQRSVLSDRDRLASSGKSRVWRGAI